MWIPPAWSPFAPAHVVRALFAGQAAVERLEGHLKERFAALEAVATGSGTEALQVAIRLAVGVRDGSGGVALPAYGCFDLMTAAVGVGAPVTFYDIDPSTLVPEPESLAAAVRHCPAVVVANLYGFPLGWDTIREVVGDRVVIEDAAQGIGSAWRGQEGGTFGDLTVLSFGRGKGWTGGGGGALLVRRRGLDDARGSIRPASGRRVRDATASAASWLLARPYAYALPARAPMLELGETVYHPPTPPAAAGCFNASLALLSSQAALREVAIRRGHAQELRAHLAAGSSTVALPEPLPRGTSSFLRLPVLAPRSWISRDLRRAGVYRGYPRPLPELPQARPLRRGEEEAVLPGAAELADRLVTLPTHSRSDPSRVLTLLGHLLLE